MTDLKERIHKSAFKTQERFAYEAGINEGILSKYVRGLRKPNDKHKAIIEKLLKKSR